VSGPAKEPMIGGRRHLVTPGDLIWDCLGNYIRSRNWRLKDGECNVEQWRAPAPEENDIMPITVAWASRTGRRLGPKHSP